jgi:hypothetical protein
MRRGRFKLHPDAVFCNDPVMDVFFRNVRIYAAKKSGDLIAYKAMSPMFDEISEDEREPLYEIYLEGGKVFAERV